MKYLLVLLFILPFSAYAQESEQYFAITYTTGAKWDTTMAPNEQPYFKEHSMHLASLRKSGKIALGARFGDKGFIVLKVKDEAEAKAILAEDKSVKHGTFEALLERFYPFYEGCVGEPGN